MSYSLALEEQLAQSRAWAGHLGKTKTGPESALGAFFPRADSAQAFMVNHLMYADTYFLSAALTSVIGSAGQDIPDSQIACDMIPSRVGWLWLATPIAVPGLTVVPEKTCMSVNLRAISWTISYQEPNGRTYAVIDGDVEPGSVPHALTLLTYFDCSEMHKPEFVSIDTWVFGENLSDIQPAQEAYDSITPGDRDALMSSGRCITPFARRLFLSLCTFIQQRILVTPKHMAERHTRRRLEREGWTHEPLVRVVELRRKQVHGTPSGDHEAVDWSHQWVVSGHWRQQWYPSLNANQPRWIMPYVKGPEDKPLKPPRAKVFAVVR